MRGEVILILGIALTVFLTLCNFHLIGRFGEAISSFLFGTFGLTAYLAPVCLFFAVSFGYANRGSFAAMLKLGAAVALFFLTGIVADMIAGISARLSVYSAKELYVMCSESRSGGGILAGSLSYGMLHSIGTAGTILILIALFAICFVLLTRRSLVGMVKSGGHSIAQQARNLRGDRPQLRLTQRPLGPMPEDPYDAASGEEEFRGKALPAAADPAETEGSPESRPRGFRKTLMEELQERSEARKGQREEKGREREQLREQERARREEERRLRREERETDRILQVEKTAPGKPDIYSEDSYRSDLHEVTFPEEEVAVDAYGHVRSAYEEPEGSCEPEEIREPEETPYAEDLSEPVHHLRFEKQPIRDHHQVELSATGEILLPEQYLDAPAGEATDLRPDSTARTRYRVQKPEKPDVVMGEDMIPVPQHSKDLPAREHMPADLADEPVRTPEKKRTESGSAQTPSVRPYDPSRYQLPPVRLLNKGDGKPKNRSDEIERNREKLLSTLASFGVNVVHTDVTQGPTVTRYEIYPEQGVKVAKITGLTDDIKMSLAATNIRIEAPIPGKSAVGIEVPNAENTTIMLRELIESSEFKEAKSRLSFAVGKDIAGETVVTDIAKMPHVLIAGSTGSGKSVCINTLIVSILFKARPDEVQMILIDPKVVEMSVYNGIPHLAVPVVTDPKQAAATLQWAVEEMQRRYRLFEDCKVRDLKGYHEKLEQMSRSGESAGEAKLHRLPQIVIIIDELADLMMVAAGDVEQAICRLAQLARAAGIHLVVATQRPSVDVITGLIKANMPSRIAFAVTSGVDSRTILDSVGAEKLLGKGDMLFHPQGTSKPARLQGAFVSDEEVFRVVEFLVSQKLGNPFKEEYSGAEENIRAIASESGGKSAAGSAPDDGRDELFAEAGRLITGTDKKASVGYLQRALKIGFNRAARIMDSLAEAGVVSGEQGTKAREVLMTPEEFEAWLQEEGNE